MNYLIDSLNLFGHRFMDFMWPMLWQSSLLIAVLFALDSFLRRHVRAVVRHALWLLILVKLLLPTSLSLPTSPGYWVRSPYAFNLLPLSSSEPLASAGSQVPLSYPPPGTIAPVGISQEAHTAATPRFQEPPRASKLRWPGLVLLSWMSGVLLLGAWMLHRGREVWRIVIHSSVARTELRSLLDECASQMDIRTHIALRESRDLATPAVCGLMHPVVLLPATLAGRLTSAQLQTILLHELAHIRRRDLWASHFQTVLQIVYFFHPLLWLANAAIRRVREEAADETVLVALAGDATTYSETLLSVARFSIPNPGGAIGLVGILETKSTLGQRIRLMLLRPLPSSERVGIKGAVGLLTVALILLPMSCSKKPGAKATGPAPEVKAVGAKLFHEGRSAEEWFNQMSFNGSINRKEFVQAVSAFRAMGDGTVPFLREKLAAGKTPAENKRSAEARRRAAWLLKELAPASAQAIPELTSALEDEEYAVGAYAAMALGALGPKAQAAVPALFESLRYGNGGAANALVLIAPDHPDLVPALIEVLKNPPAVEVRQAGNNAQMALSKLGPRAAAAIPTLRKLLAGENAWAAEAALRRIAGDQPDIMTEVDQAVKRKREPLQSITDLIDAAEKNLTDFDLQRLGHALIWAREDGKPVPEELISNRIMPLITNALETGDARIFSRIFWVSKDLGPQGKSFVPRLIQFLEKDDSENRASVLGALAGIAPADPQTLPIIIRLTDDWSDGVRHSACNALTYFGPEAKAAVPALHKRLNDSLLIRFNSTLALWRIAREPPSIPLLAEALRQDNDNWVPLRTIEMIGGMQRQTDEGRSIVRNLARHWQPEVRANALALLEKLGEKPPPKAGAATVPVNSTVSLRKIGVRAAAAASQVRSTLDDPSSAVRMAAQNALAAMHPPESKQP